jgi:hypothetical protein
MPERRRLLEVGLLWYDDSKADFAAKVHEAAQRYEEKFGHKPNCCYINPDCPQGDAPRANGVRLVTNPAILPNHFWVGIASGSPNESARAAESLAASSRDGRLTAHTPKALDASSGL